jgi:hypothetical protein
MTRDTVDPDPVVDRNERLGRVAVSASSPGGQARLPPHWMGLEDLPGLFPLVIAPLVRQLNKSPPKGEEARAFLTPTSLGYPFV